MSELIQNAKICLKYDSLSNWNTKNPTLRAGEVGFIKDNGMYKVGNGSSSWTDLPSPNFVVKKNGDPTSADSDYDFGTLWFNSKAGTLFCLDRSSNWSKMALDDDLQELKEKLNDYMLTEEYVGATAVKAVEQANTLKANGGYVAVDDNSTDGLWSAEHTDAEIATAKDAAVAEAVKQITAKKGVVNGFASLDANGTVPAGQLPSYVDDVVEVATYSKLVSDAKYKETGKIFIVAGASADTGDQEHTQWRWVSSTVGFVQITSGNIIVDDDAQYRDHAYSQHNGQINRDVLQAVTKTINGSDYNTFNQESAVSKGTISDRLDTLEEYHATKIKTTALKNNAKADPDLMYEEDLADLNVTTDKLANGSVTAIKLAENAVTGASIANGTIMLKHLAGEVTAAIADATGSTPQQGELKEDCIVTDYIADNAVTNDKILSVSLAKVTQDSSVTLILNCGNASSN